MALKFTTTDKSSVENGVKCLVYGGAGVGKTVLCGTAPNPIILSAEAGLLSLRSKSIPVIEINSIDDLRDAYTWITTDKKGLSFDTICLDSVSEIAEQILSHEKSIAKDARQAYGALAEQVIALVKKFRDIDKNVLVIAKEQSIIDSNSNIKLLPAMPGTKLGGQLSYYFDEVLHMEIAQDDEGNKIRVLRTASNFISDAKDRSGILEELEEPNITNIIKKIKELKK